MAIFPAILFNLTASVAPKCYENNLMKGKWEHEGLGIIKNCSEDGEYCISLYAGETSRDIVRRGCGKINDTRQVSRCGYDADELKMSFCGYNMCNDYTSAPIGFMEKAIHRTMDTDFANDIPLLDTDKNSSLYRAVASLDEKHFENLAKIEIIKHSLNQH